VISPILANLFLHYAFDMWMMRTFPAIPFERYADDCICHCRSEEEARALWEALEARFVACGLVLHPQKTKLVYCKDTNRRGDFPIQSFTFLGYMFRPRKAMWRGGQYGVSFLPAARPDAPESNQADGPTMGTPSSERHGPGGSGTEIQPVYPRLDQLLQPLLQVGISLDVAPG
jgi:RNA-directed DNA polymerase